MDANPQVSVIVCHHVGRDLLNRCIQSYRNAYWSYPYTELIVVTSDPTLTNPLIDKLLFLEDGPAAKRNLGVEHATGEVIVFLDDDVEIKSDCLKAFVDFFADHPDAGMLFAKIYKMEEGRRDEFDDCGSWLTASGFLYARAGAGQRDRGQYETAVPILASKSATCAIRRSAFESSGGFDPTYYILGEETDLAWRVWLSGLTVWYVPTAISWHAFGCESLKPKADYYTIERTMTYGARNYLSLLWTHLGTARLVAILPAHVSAWIAALLGFSARGDGRRALAIMRGLWQALYRLPDLCRKRHHSQSRRRVSDRHLWPLISYQPPVSYYATRLWRYWTTQLHGGWLLLFLLNYKNNS